MPSFSASAPGKIILFGEHAVVYGQPAIAVQVIPVKARAIVTARPDRPRGWVGVQAPDIDLETTLADLPADDPLARVISGVLETIVIPQPPACTVRITSTIPIAAGLGSGAAISVAIIRAFSEFLGRPLPNEQVSDLAFEVEKLHHGTPSGIDNTVVTYERPVYFTKSNDAASGQMMTLKVAKPFTLVIGDSGVSSPTALTVGDVRQAWLKDGELYEGLFASTGDLVKSARSAIENGDTPLLGQLMDANQEILEKIGVSSPDLERLIQAARQAGAYGAKLSGGGRGGNMIALAPIDATSEVVEALTKASAKSSLVTVVSS